MADITFPIQVNLPDDWVEQIIDRLRNDPAADWVDVTRCKDCKYHRQNYAGDSWCGHPKGLDGFELMPTDFCSAAERRTNERETE